MKKLDESKVEWIISQKRKGVATSSIAETMNVSARWVKKLWARYRHADAGKIIYPAPMGRPKNGLPGRREHSAVLTARTGNHLGAVRLHGIIQASTEIDIPCICVNPTCGPDHVLRLTCHLGYACGILKDFQGAKSPDPWQNRQPAKICGSMQSPDT